MNVNNLSKIELMKLLKIRRCDFNLAVLFNRTGKGSLSEGPGDDVRPDKKRSKKSFSDDFFFRF